jgi:hypothetical protein
MLYEVTYQVGGEQQMERVDAPDAATAAATVRDLHGRSSQMFELILVHLVDDASAPHRTAPDGDATGSGR